MDPDFSTGDSTQTDSPAHCLNEVAHALAEVNSRPSQKARTAPFRITRRRLAKEKRHLARAKHFSARSKRRPARDKHFSAIGKRRPATGSAIFRTDGDWGAGTAPAIFTPTEIQKILAACPDNLLPHMVIGAFSGIRAAEIERLEWSKIMWDRGYIEIKAAKAKTKARRLVPILPNLRAWLEPMKKEQGRVCFLRNLHLRLTCFGEKSGVGWKQNALRHSFASYRLAEIQDAARVALEMGNTPPSARQ